ncbi:MAG: hypothetical protein WB709_11975 [Solirubrobacteraceae bacterium]
MSVHDVTRAGAERASDDNVLTWLARLDTSGRSWEAQLAPVSMELVDALVHADPQALQQLGDPIRDTLAKHFDGSGYAREARGYLLAVLAMTRLGLERLPDASAVRLSPDSHAASALVALASRGPMSNQELREQLETSGSQLSRVGRQLLADGLVIQRRTGRTASWEITPRGRIAAEEHRGARRTAAR